MHATPPQTRSALAAAGSRAPALSRTLRLLAVVVLLLLLAQFVVGMVVNLYVQIPSVHPGTQGATPFSENLPEIVQGLTWVLAHGDLALRIHVVLGLLLGLTGLAILGTAIAARRRVWIVVAVAGFLAIAGAGANGIAFLNAGSEALNSLAMAIDFLLALVVYAIGLYATR